MHSQPIVRVLVADEQPLYAHGLRRLLEEAGGFEVVGQTSDASEALQLAASLRPDEVFLDAALAGAEYRTLAQMVSNGEKGDLKVILAVPDSESGPLLGLFLGARGILARTAPLGLVEKAARCVAAGQYWVDREAVGDMVRWLRETNPDRRAKAPASSGRLTRRERDIVAAVAAGHCNKEVASQLSIAEDTVKHHLSSIFAKLHVSNRLELAVFAIQNGLVEQPVPSSR